MDPVIASGTRLGAYEVTAKLGEGGMGEVWRAQDSRLGREVALKVLPEGFTEDPERTARFEREAKLLASLNHPNIAQIYGLETSGETRALVMELVEGPTLAERLEQGALPLSEVLSIAKQIAEALEEAHEKGIIHRDLKPQNVKAPIEGKVKVLDFGLAKALDPSGASGIAAASASQLAHSPTMTLGKTVQGVILGTAAYMAPEQARGMAVDHRADVWAFGVVLYEMLAGGSLFAAHTVTDTLAGVLKSDIDLDRLPPSTPPAVRRLLRRCLERNAKNRLHAIADARLVLDDVLAGRADAAAGAGATAAGNRWLRLVPWALAAGLSALLLVRGAGGPATGPAVGARAVELSVPRGNLLFDDAPVALAPDGGSIVFGAADPLSGNRLWLRRLDRFEAEPLADTETGILPFWSPDSQSIGFFRSSDQTLCRYDLTTGKVQVLAKTGALGRGGDWGTDGTILYAPSANSSIVRLPPAGGEPEEITRLDPSILDGSHRYPVRLPDGEHFLFTLWSNHLETAARIGGIYLASFEEGILRKLTPDVSRAVLVGRDRLLVRRDGALVALPFDAEKLEITGRGETIAEAPLFAPHSGAVSATGTPAGDIAFALASGEGSGRLTWLDRRGESVGTIGTERMLIRSVAPAPDGNSYAIQVATATGGNIWIGDERRQVMNRVTPEGIDATLPVWSPASDRIAYVTEASGKQAVWIQLADGSRAADKLVSDSKRDFRATHWSADGRHLLLDSNPEDTVRTDLWIYDFQSGEARELLTDGAASLSEATLSADGRWLAYTSDESGNPEVFVRPFPALDRKWKISQGGGYHPHWRDDGRELLFVALADHGVHAVAIETRDGGLEAGVPQLLFAPRSPLLALAPAPDHSRLLAGVLPGDVRSEPIHLVLRWRAADSAGGAR
jgi:Tol biopolymer transport system component